MLLHRTQDISPCTGGRIITDTPRRTHSGCGWVMNHAKHSTPAATQ